MTYISNTSSVHDYQNYNGFRKTPKGETENVKCDKTGSGL